MKPVRLLLFLMATILQIGCTEKRIVRPGPEITFDRGRLLYQGDEFTGVVIENYENVGTTRETHYRKGLPDGVQVEHVIGGKMILAKRTFKNGENEGVHEGWFADGKRRFHYEYQDGKANGEFWEWHRSGHPSLFARFEKDNLIGKKRWREDGKIYMNYVFPKGQAVGLPGTKLCFQVRAGQAVAGIK
ncbi:MAG: toxin-antitoxin system YwqK family antitoxin [Bdellovibrionales bacterium]